MKPVGLHAVCSSCASAASGTEGVCVYCKKPSVFLQITFAQWAQLKKEIQEQKDAKLFSLHHCDEVLAGWFVLLVGVLLILFIALGS